MIADYFSYSISITFISWIVGMIIHAIIKNQKVYRKMENYNFIKSKKLNRNIGLAPFKWVVKNTFFRFFNPELKLKRSADLNDLIHLRNEMTSAELSHLIAFGFVCFFMLEKLISGEFLFALIFFIVNALMNLYPSLLQQENKLRIDTLIKRMRRKS